MVTLKMLPISHENENPEVRDACGHPGELQFTLPMSPDLVFKSECPFCTKRTALEGLQHRYIGILKAEDADFL